MKIGEKFLVVIVKSLRLTLSLLHLIPIGSHCSSMGNGFNNLHNGCQRDDPAALLWLSVNGFDYPVQFPVAASLLRKNGTVDKGLAFR